MPHSTHGTVILMGSGEMAPSMVETHKYGMGRVAGSLNAAFLDTPAGFQLNADLLAERAIEYFDKKLNTPLKHITYKDSNSISEDAMQAAVKDVYDATYIFAGPGSPTYAVQHWRNTPLQDAIFETLTAGGCLTFASAAALTLGRWTIPVYEVYKVGAAPVWTEGLNLLAHNGLDLAIVPHWNNNSGGDHDTRFCFMGEPRWETLFAQLPPETTVLGLDEHTACILLMDDNLCEVRGVGQVTVIRGEEVLVFKNGDSFNMDMLRPAEISNLAQGAEVSKGTDTSLSWADIRDHHEELLSNSFTEVQSMRKYIYNLLTMMSQARENKDWETLIRAEEALREAVVSALTTLDTAPVDVSAIIAPYVELALNARQELRKLKQFALADSIRDQLIETGLAVQDTPQGTDWEVAS